MIKQTNETWLNATWRPAVAWAYLAICCFDFVIAPILWSLLQAYQNGIVAQQWQPITLVGAGLFHAAMGAVLGIHAWTRGQEKLEYGRHQRPPQRYDYYDDREPYGDRYGDKDREYGADPKVTYRPRNR